MREALTKATDQRIILFGTWEHFKFIQRGFENTPGAKLSYYQETIEILMPGEDHEFFSRVIHYLVTTFLLHKGVQFKMTGAKTQEKEGEASIQADESYCIGACKPIPDLSIEIIFASGSVNKLARYQALDIPEVWFWQDGSLKLYHLRNFGYEPIERSELPGLEELNIDRLRRCILMADSNFALAVKTFQGSI